MSDEYLAELRPASEYKLRVRCGSAAPLVVNGGHFVGCQLDKAHEGKHKVVIEWGEL